MTIARARPRPALSAEMDELARMLADARRSQRQMTALADRFIPPSADVAYEVNHSVSQRLGWDALGWKIAGTTQAVRDRLRLDGPIYGRTFRRFLADSPARLSWPVLLDPLVECEFFVTLNAPLAWRAQAWTRDEVLAAIGSVHAGIEVAECRFPNAAMPPLPAVLADGAASGWYVRGPEISDWRDGLAGIEVRVELDGRMRRTGSGSEVMGDPLVPLVWLAETLRQRGLGIAAGETVSTGSMTGMLPVHHPGLAVARFGDHGAVEIDFHA